MCLCVGSVLCSVCVFTISIWPTGPPNLVRGQLWHQVVTAPPNRSCGGSDRGPLYQVPRQSQWNQLTIGIIRLFVY